MKNSNFKISNSVISKACLLACLFMSMDVFGQDEKVINALTAAQRSMAGYFDGASKLVYAISGIIGLIGAIKVYSKWNSGDPDTQKVAAAWFGACIFLVVVATVIKTFFGIDDLR